MLAGNEPLAGLAFSKKHVQLPERKGFAANNFNKPGSHDLKIHLDISCTVHHH